MVDYPNDNAGGQSLPIKLGTSGGNANDLGTKVCCIGTLGSLLMRGGVFYVLSNNHVLARSGQGVAGEEIDQPGQSSCFPGENAVAHLTEAAALKPNPCNGSPCTGPAPSNVDAAIAQIVSGTVDTSGNILDLGAAGSTSIAPAPPSATLANPANVLAANEGVTKSGRTTGLTCSTLQSVSTNIQVSYDSSCGGSVAFNAQYTNQVVVNGGTFSSGGDSGSLIVTSDTARPVALLYGGNNTSTTGNPIQDIIATFTNGSGAPAFVGGADHTVSCQPTAQASSTTAGQGAQNVATLTPGEVERAKNARDAHASQLMGDPGVAEVSVGASADGPRQGAVLVRVTSSLHAAIPEILDGVRTRVIYNGVPVPRASVADIREGALIKDKHVEELFQLSGVQGVGVGVSDDNTAETALVIYVDIGQPRAEIPAVIDGMRTKIIEGDRFRAFEWGSQPAKRPGCSVKSKTR